MSRNANTVSVTILEKEYQVACPAEQHAELLLSARHLDERMRAIRSTGKVIGLERIAVMAALNISHELLQTRNGVSTADSTPPPTQEELLASPALAGLNAKLDQALHQLRQLEIG